MKAFNLWNSDFDDLMSDLDKFLAETPDITVTHLDWKYAQTGENTAYWYLVLLYSGGTAPAEDDVTASEEDPVSPE